MNDMNLTENSGWTQVVRKGKQREVSIFQSDISNFWVKGMA